MHWQVAFDIEHGRVMPAIIYNIRVTLVGRECSLPGGPSTGIRPRSLRLWPETTTPATAFLAVARYIGAKYDHAYRDNYGESFQAMQLVSSALRASTDWQQLAPRYRDASGLVDIRGLR
jgi:hypothetical protein